MSQFWVWAGGYSGNVTKSDPPEHLEQIRKIGATVILATAVATLDWFAASFAYTAGLGDANRLIIAALMGALGAAIVLAIDRTAVFSLDTRRPNAGVAFYLAIRFALILVVSSFTAEVTSPLIMRSELDGYALQMREASDEQRFRKLSARYELPQHKLVAAQATGDRKRIEDEADVVPAPIQSEIAAGTACWHRYWVARRSRLNSGVDEEEARQQLRPLFNSCAAARRQANADLFAYRIKMANKLAVARAHETTAVGDLASARNEIADRETEATEIENKAIGPTSSVVLWRLITTDRGAALKYLLFVALLLILETLPLTTKLLSGRSAPGARIGASRDIAVLEHDTRAAIRRNECNMELEASAAMTEASIQALRSAATDVFMQEYFLRQAQAMAPMEAARHALRRMEVEQRDLDEMAKRRPQLGPLIAEVWAKAIRDTTEILTRT